MKVVEAKSPVLPVTERVYVPGTAIVETVNPLPVNWPDVLMVHVEGAPTIVGVCGA
jgi:hypothetical protein